jgi:hypothetical protein
MNKESDLITEDNNLHRIAKLVRIKRHAKISALLTIFLLAILNEDINSSYQIILPAVIYLVVSLYRILSLTLGHFTAIGSFLIPGLVILLVPLAFERANKELKELGYSKSKNNTAVTKVYEFIRQRPGLYKPFLIFRVLRSLSHLTAAAIVAALCWVISISLELQYSPSFTALVESGQYELHGSRGGHRLVSGTEWYLRAFLGEIFSLFHAWIHITVIFSAFTNHHLIAEKKYVDTDKPESKWILAFLHLFPLAWYIAISTYIYHVFNLMIYLLR